MKKAIITSSILAITAYVIFSFSVISTLGASTPEIATLALGKTFTILGIVTMFTAFLALSFAIRDMYTYDFRIPEKKSFFLASIVPLALLILITTLNLASFTQILAISGTVSGGVTGILIMLMNKSAKSKGNRNPEYSMKLSKIAIAILSLVFILGILYCSLSGIIAKA